MDLSHPTFPPYLMAAGLLGTFSGALVHWLSDPATQGLRSLLASAVVTLVVALAGYIKRRLDNQKEGLSEAQREHIEAMARGFMTEIAKGVRALPRVPALESSKEVKPPAAIVPLQGILIIGALACAGCGAGTLGTFDKIGSVASWLCRNIIVPGAGYVHTAATNSGGEVISVPAPQSIDAGVE